VTNAVPSVVSRAQQTLGFVDLRGRMVLFTRVRRTIIDAEHLLPGARNRLSMDVKSLQFDGSDQELSGLPSLIDHV